jgi:hypothetical protein
MRHLAYPALRNYIIVTRQALSTLAVITGLLLLSDVTCVRVPYRITSYGIACSLHTVVQHASEVQLRKAGATMRPEAYRGARLKQIRHKSRVVLQPMQWLLGTLSPGIKRPRREANYSLQLVPRSGIRGYIHPLPHTYSRRST